MLIHKCVLRRENLPVLPCDCDLCDWYIHSSTYNCCFWVLAQFLDINPGTKLTFEEIATIENIPQDQVIAIYESALNKLRQGSKQIEKDAIFDDEN